MKPIAHEELLVRNIDAVHTARKSSADKRRFDQRTVDRLAAYFGTVGALYVHICVYGCWTMALLKIFGISTFDEHLTSIAFAASIEAIGLAIFVLINQRHMNHVERHNADLNLQMSIMAESKVTEIAKLLHAVALKVGVNPCAEANVEQAKTESKPEAILEQIVQREALISPETAMESEASPPSIKES